ncbi:MAG: hypothetical protein K2Y40_24620 [Reyranella sp.]|jgi:hypothetical protein|nr:hypothetical protein [Reyranella sp.]
MRVSLAVVAALVLVAGDLTSAHAQAPPAAPANAALAARCAQLIAFFDRYGVSRSLNSDGARNHTRIDASVDCQRGEYAKGIATMEALLRRKAFSVPPPNVPYDEPQDLGIPDNAVPKR